MKHLILLLPLLLLTACNTAREKAETAAAATLARYAASLETQNIAAINTLFTPDSPERAALVDALATLFTRYTLTYRIDATQTIAYEKNRILLQADMTVARRAGLPFETQYRTDRYELHRTGSDWRIYATQSISTRVSQ